MPQNNHLPILWTPSTSIKKSSHLYGYMDWLCEEKSLDFKDYDELWQWSCDNLEIFWESIVQYFDIKLRGQYGKILNNTMPDCSWFEGSKVNYGEHLVRDGKDGDIAILFENEKGEKRSVEWKQFKKEISAFRSYLIAQGVVKGDRVVSYLPNIPEAVIAFVATASIGAIWSSCSPDFGVSSVIDRFKQVEPKVLIAADGYHYNGKHHSRINEIEAIASSLKSIISVVMVNYTGIMIPDNYKSWRSIVEKNIDRKLSFDAVEFNDPLWILYSSGTTGLPKAITQSHGGVLIEHIKYMSFHNDVQKGERFFWFTTTGWMMWNYLVGSLLSGATIVLYDGSPAFPDISRLWNLASDIRINHFGTSAPFIMACMKQGLDLKGLDLNNLRSIGSTGSPLPPEAFQYVYDHISNKVWLCSMAGGTDVCTAFIGGNPLLPVVRGEIQCRALGVNLHAYNEDGARVIDQLGEMVIESPMPSMPIYFWKDTDKKRYKASYFEMYPGIWRHGDWIKINSRGGLIIYGRSDATLNRHGIRIGTSEIYSSLSKIDEVEDSLIVNIELKGGGHFMPLFVNMAPNTKLDEGIKQKINARLRSDYSPRHVPDLILEVDDIPYTISGKKLEAPVKKILMGLDPDKVANKEAMRNPKALDFFIENQKELTNSL